MYFAFCWIHNLGYMKAIRFMAILFYGHRIMLDDFFYFLEKRCFALFCPGLLLDFGNTGVYVLGLGSCCNTLISIWPDKEPSSITLRYIDWRRKATDLAHIESNEHYILQIRRKFSSHVFAIHLVLFQTQMSIPARLHGECKPTDALGWVSRGPGPRRIAVPAKGTRQLPRPMCGP